MKKILLASVASMLVATPAFAAPSDEDSFDVTASVAPTCVMENIADINLGDLPIVMEAGTNALLITGNVAEPSGSFWVSCNDTNSMTVASANNGRLTNQDRSFDPAIDDASFSDSISYRMAVSNYLNGSSQPGFIGSTTFNEGVSRGAIHRQLDITASVLGVSNKNRRPLAGNYLDTVTVTVTTL